MGSLMAANGEAGTGIAELEAGLKALAELSILMHAPYFRLMLADAHVIAGRPDQALTILDEALTISAETTESWLDAELHRRCGEVLLALGPSNEADAERHFLQAVGIARAESAKLWELRAPMALTRLWRDQNRRHEARDLLMLVLDWFTEGVDRPDLIEARELSASL